MNRSMRQVAPALAAFVLLGLAACGGAGSGHVFELEGEGDVRGRAFLDLTRTGAPASGDPILPDLEVFLIREGTRDTVAAGVSDTTGFFLLEGIPPGTYRAEPAPTLLADTLVVTAVQPPTILVQADRLTNFTMGISFPVRTIPEVRNGPLGVRVYVEGTALNSFGAPTGGVIHIWDGERAVRAVQISSFTVSPGDSVRILGRTATVAGQRMLEGGFGRRLAERNPPVPIDVTTAAAAAAEGGLEAALVRVGGAVVSGVEIVSGVRVVTASDGSGALVLRFSAGIQQGAGIEQVEEGMVLSATGLLVPRDDGTGWDLMPRNANDLAVTAPAGVAGIAASTMGDAGAE